jgi:hypothetical protein
MKCSPGLGEVLKPDAAKPIVLVGINYQHRRFASDKTFMYDIVRHAVSSGEVMPHIISVVESAVHGVPLRQEMAVDGVAVQLVPRALHRVRRRNEGDFESVHQHGHLREYSERILTTLALVRNLRRLRRETGAEYVHFFDNFGPLTAWAAHRAGLRCGVTLLGSTGPRVSRVRRAFWRASFIGVDDLVVGSPHLADGLRSAGFHPGE